MTFKKSKHKKPQNIKKSILITGATGYLGSKLAHALVNRNEYEIIILKRKSSNTFRISELLGKIKMYDLDMTPLEDIFLENKIDTVLHCATDYGRKDVNPLQVIEANLLLPVRLLEFGRKHDIRCFINTDTILDKRINHYSLSKRHFNDWLMSYRKNVLCINVALEHFYGPGDDTTKFASFVVHSLLKKVDKIDLTAGEQKRDFIFIHDVVSAFLRIIDYSSTLRKDFYEFQIGGSEPVTIKEFVLMIKRLTGNTTTILNFGALPYREDEIMECRIDVEPIKKLGWKTMYSLEEGLKLMIEQEVVYTVSS
jgi:nucleoside-diphosphate-sugar epimerase